MSCADCGRPLPQQLGSGRPRLRCFRCAALRIATRQREWCRARALARRRAAAGGAS